MVWDEIVAFPARARDRAARGWRGRRPASSCSACSTSPSRRPIRYFERRYHGGFGVMFDDIVAAAYTLVVLAVIKRLFF